MCKACVLLDGLNRGLPRAGMDRKKPGSNRTGSHNKPQQQTAGAAGDAVAGPSTSTAPVEGQAGQGLKSDVPPQSSDGEPSTSASAVSSSTAASGAAAESGAGSGPDPSAAATSGRSGAPQVGSHAPQGSHGVGASLAGLSIQDGGAGTASGQGAAGARGKRPIVIEYDGGSAS